MSFESDIQAFINRTNARANTVVKKVVLEISRQVIRKSPVDTGRFKGNWQLGVNAPAFGQLETTDASGGRTIAAITSNIPAQAVGNVYYVTNNLPYAQALEDGHSPQSPPGNMVAGTVATFQRIVSGALDQ